MEVRGNNKNELAAVEGQLATLSHPSPPRPVKTVQEALAATSVPPAIWKDSNECNGIQESAYFAKQCARVVQLRRELAAAQDYERLSGRATELRNGLAQAPIVATSDPLPATFSATLGRLVPIGGTEGVALLITLVVEIISGFGLAGIRAVRECSREVAKASLTPPSLAIVKCEGGSLPLITQSLPQAQTPTLPNPSLKASAPAQGRGRAHTTGEEGSCTPSNALPSRLRPPCADLPCPSSARERGASVGELPFDTSHVSDFARERLRPARGASVSSKELRAAYEAWCATRGYTPLSWEKFAGELNALGYTKWKSCGRMRYRDLELVA
jgi:hypothetical protein